MAKYMLLLHDEPSQWQKLSPEEMQKAMQKYMAWSKKPFTVGGNKLTRDPGRVMRSQGGQPRATDGPIAKPKRFWAVFISSKPRITTRRSSARSITRTWSSGPSRSGKSNRCERDTRLNRTPVPARSGAPDRPLGATPRSNTGFDRLPAILEAYPKTTFLAHANSWWAHIGADVDDTVAYPTGRIKPGGLTDKMLADYPNVYGDLSANSGRNALARDPDFAAAFLARHRNKLIFGSDCGCRDGHGTDQPQAPLHGKCTARETLTLLKQMASPELFRQIAWDNGTKLLKISAWTL